MNPDRPREFDAVAESRKWKEAVARETAGMTTQELLAYFDKDRVLALLDARLNKTAVVQEGPPHTAP